MLDEDNVEFNNAAELVRHTDKLVYITGKAGTGKTTFLKYIKETTTKNTVILAPTGVAANNAGGVTIHSFFQIPLGPFVPDDSRLRIQAAGTTNRETIYTTFNYRQDKLNVIKNLELLIIDEISMVRADTLDVIDKILRTFRKKPNLDFGGVQVILIGDTFQLAPIADGTQWEILSAFYKTPFFFSSRVMEECSPLYIELKKIYRQSEKEFIELLDRVRVSQVNANDIKVLNEKFDPTFTGSGSDYIVLATHNHIVKEINLIKLNEIKSRLFCLEAKVTNIFPEKNKPTDQNLNLKIGAQIMFVKNDNSESKSYFNGKIGKIKYIEEGLVKVQFDDDSEVDVKRAKWNHISYSYNIAEKKIVEKIEGTFEQFPLRLAWAITVHKSQGLTFKNVIADLANAFAPGQVYVALSRCTALSGLKLKSQIIPSIIITDPRVIEFAKNETPNTMITAELSTGKADSHYKLARGHIKNGNLKSAYKSFKKAIRFRNDVETDIFERYIEVQGKRMFRFKEKNTSLVEKIELLTTNLCDSEEIVNSQIKKLAANLKASALQNNRYDQLSNRTLVLSNEIEKLKKTLMNEERKLVNSKNRTKSFSKSIKELENELNTTKFQNEKNLAELRRLNALTWYDKVLGKR